MSDPAPSSPMSPPEVTLPATLRIDDPVLHDFAAEVGTEGPVTVVGGRTRWTVGGVVEDAAREISAPMGIVAYTPDEMTVQVRAGTTVAELHHALAERNQRTALPQRSETSTIGGALAVGENDVHVLGRGRLRTALLQVRYVSAEGRLVTGGGPTVKNVSGFDLPRLMVGSLGTLGLLAEVILRTNPIPAVSVWLTSGDCDPYTVLDTVRSPSAVLHAHARTWVQLEGHGPDIEHERTKLETIGTFVETESGPELPPHRWSLSPADLRRFRGPADSVLSIGVGTVWSSEAQPSRLLSGPSALISSRLKREFDPTGRLNPGRNPAMR